MFEHLYDEGATATEQYDALVKANEFAASEILPLAAADWRLGLFGQMPERQP